MHKPLADWFEARTGWPQAVRSVLLEPLPGGARWRYVFGPALGGAFAVQAVTGLLLMTAYVPSAAQAWGSVWFIHSQMTLGWFVRGMHHWGSSAVVILLAFHLAQVVFTAAYRAPREVNWWVGLGLMQLVLGLALTGYLLPWDQKGYWAAKVATNIAGSTPVIGPSVQALIVGGTEYGNATLPRLYAIHVALLPLGIVILLAVHLRLRYRHGRTTPDGPVRPDAPAWPGQFVRNLAAIGLVVALVAGWTLREHGANLDAPADPSQTDYPARPEWYFLPLYQLLNEFKAPYEIIGTMIIPGMIITFLAALPLLDRVLPRKLVRAAASLLVVGLGVGVSLLMFKAVSADARDAEFQARRQKADAILARAHWLAEAQGVPPDGALYVTRRDPMLQGRAVLEQKCLGCHFHGGRGLTQTSRFKVDPAASTLEALKDSLLGFTPDDPAAWSRPLTAPIAGRNDKGERTTVHRASGGAVLVVASETLQTAPDLFHYGSRGWLRGLLDDPGGDRYFGQARGCGGMVKWKDGSSLEEADLNQVADFFAEHVMTIPEDLAPADWIREMTRLEEAEQNPGWTLFQEDCATCHNRWDGPNAKAPNLYGWGSPWWIARLIRNPASAHFYGFLEAEFRMPGFAGQLTADDLATVVRYLKDDYLGAETPPPGLGGRMGPIDPR